MTSASDTTEKSASDTTTVLENDDYDDDSEKINATTIDIPTQAASGPASSNAEFQAWIESEIIRHAPQMQVLYPQLVIQTSEAVTKWRQRYRGDAPLWNRLFKRERVIKEVVESIPVIASVQDWISRRQQQQQQQQQRQQQSFNKSENKERIVILDLCSGKGYLSMLLSEILPPDQVEKCLLIDKAWPLCHSVPKSHHISWEHIYGDLTNPNGPRYFETWPIPLHTSKLDLKQSREIRLLQERFDTISENNNDSDPLNIKVQTKGMEQQAVTPNHSCNPVLILGVHLCGTLSIQAIKLFQTMRAAQLLLLKPCCLPDIWHARNHDVFQIGEYCFPTKDVCAGGKWTSNKQKGRWEGPPRWHLKNRFEKWCYHLNQAMGQEKEICKDDSGSKSGEIDPGHTTSTAKNCWTKIMEVPIQSNGGYQNVFLLAEKVAQYSRIE